MFMKAAKVLCLCVGIFVCCLLNACKEEKPAPKYVFLFIGDGFSFAQRQIAEMARGEELVSSGFPVQGVMTVSAADSFIPDSAASASAFSTGKRIPNGNVAFIPESEGELDLITELAAKSDMNTAVLTTASADDATPAAFYARSAKRTAYYDIASQLAESPLGLIAGAKFKRPRAFKKDDLNVVLKNGGRKVFIPSKDNLSYPAGRVAVTYDSVPLAIDAKKNFPSLAEMVGKAVAKAGDEKGFFIVAESAKIDVAAHMNDTAALIKEVQSFDEAVKKALEFYEKHPADTLVVVTGDHETGGLSLGAFGAENIDPSVFSVQKKSAGAFKYDVSRFKSRRAGGGVLEDFMPAVERVFGLKMLSAKEKKELKDKAADGDAQAGFDLKMALTPADVAALREALRYSMSEKSKRPKTDAFKAKYGDYDPVSVAAVRILNKKAGVAYAAFGHTASPVPVSAVGYRAETFGGVYPNTQLFSKLLGAMNIPEPATAAALPSVLGDGEKETVAAD